MFPLNLFQNAPEFYLISLNIYNQNSFLIKSNISFSEMNPNLVQQQQQQYMQQNGMIVRAPVQQQQQSPQVVLQHVPAPQTQQAGNLASPHPPTAPGQQTVTMYHQNQQQQQVHQHHLQQQQLQQQQNLQNQPPAQQLSAIPMAAFRQVHKLAPVKKPSGLDPFEVMKERENMISQKVQYRISALEAIPAKVMSEELRTRVLIELKALRLLEFQKSLRAEIVACMRADTSLETSLNPKAYKRCKRQTLREARVTEKMERVQKQEAERKKRLKHMEYLNAVVEHSKNFKDVHRANVAK